MLDHRRTEGRGAAEFLVAFRLKVKRMLRNILKSHEFEVHSVFYVQKYILSCDAFTYRCCTRLSTCEEGRAHRL